MVSCNLLAYYIMLYYVRFSHYIIISCIFLVYITLYRIVVCFCCIILHYMLDVMINSVVLVIPEYVILT